MNPKNEPPTIYRRDYQPSFAVIERIELDFDLKRERTVVRSRLTGRNLVPDGPLRLDGEELDLLSVSLNGQILSPDQVTRTERELIIQRCPERFDLEIFVAIAPAENTALEGLYASGDRLLTQCEAEGFRKITYFPDRPDVMTLYRVRLTADKAQFPVLLSNGNCVESGDLPDGRHFTVWEDPYLKPSYLFALVAGEFSCLKDRFTTMEGREVDLRIYSEPAHLNKLDYAMGALKRSMKWDEERFGLAYDLDVFNIVATNDFNMGAMENKSLNIFNAKYVLASPETATDNDFVAIEAVIGHEYFHNWTGNRVTCRDWFQLSLKEGLTVFRDQEFTADMQSQAVKRIEDVRMLRTMQFPEDSGPMAHPIRPDHYIEINNFYTLTVYEKGAEVVRLYHTLLGEEGFQRGMALYFERHDGQAVTCDDFRAAMADANGRDLDQFERWYSQSGTPRLTATATHDADARTYSIAFTQETPQPSGQTDQSPFLPQVIPIRIGLLDSSGDDLPLESSDMEGDVFELTDRAATVVFEDIDSPPVPSLLRGFSCPARLEFDYDRDQLAFLMAHDGDSFNRWDASQRLALSVILDQIGSADSAIDARLLNAASQVLEDRETDPALLAETLRLPDEEYIAQHLEWMDLPAIHAARKRVQVAIADHVEDIAASRYEQLESRETYAPVASQIGARALKNVALALLCANGSSRGFDLAHQQYSTADNMTDRLAAMLALTHNSAPSARSVLEHYREQFADDPLVMDKWFMVQASNPQADTLATVERLTGDPLFSLRNPNKVRSLLGVFARNASQFHDPDGAGYRFLAEKIVELDRLNPQVAARLVSAFNHWQRLPSGRQQKMRRELEHLAATKPLSSDVYEIVSRALG